MYDIIEKSLHDNLLNSLKTDDLWKQFMSAIAKECSYNYDFYSKIKEIYNSENKDIDTLIEVCKNFGYIPNLIIDNSIYMVQKELQSVSSRIKNKTTYKGYKLISKQIQIDSEVYNFYWNGKKLIRAIDIDKSINNVIFGKNIIAYAEQNFSSVYDGYSISLDYLENGQKIYTEDGLRKYSLDEIVDNKNWNLDKNNKIVLTKHIGIEYVPNTNNVQYTQAIDYDSDLLNFEFSLTYGDEYVEKSLKIMLDKKTYDLNFTNTIDNIEHFTCDSINIIDSTINLNTHVVKLNFSKSTNKIITIKYKSKYYISSNYFQYLENGINYNRRTPIVSHNGCQINAMCFETKGGSYIPNQDIRFSTVYAYDKRFSILKKFKLDDNPTSKLDSLVPWFLDTSTVGESPNKDEFYYLSCGEGKLNITDSEHSSIFDYNRMIMFYNFDDTDNSKLVHDVSSNKYNSNVYGETKKIKGIIGESINFNGETYCETLSISLDNSIDNTLSFWFNANAKSEFDNDNNMYLFEFYNTSLDEISAIWNYSTKTLTITYGNVVFTNNDNVDPSDDFEINYNTDYFISIQLKDSYLSMYVNGELQFYNKELESSISGQYTLNIANNHTHDSIYTGLFDSFWIMKDDYTNDNPLEYTKPSDLIYVYQNKLSTITHLGRRLNFKELDMQELYDDYEDSKGNIHNSLIVNSYIQPNKINNEYAFYPDDRETNYITHTKFSPLMDEGFELNYYEKIDNRIQKKSAFGTTDGKIYIKNTNNVIGKIDYNNGDFEIYPKIDRTINQELIYSPNIKNKNVYAIKDSEGKIEYYTNDSYTQKINYDELDTSKSTETKIEQYTIKNLNNSPLIYTSDKENYFVDRQFITKIEKYLIDENDKLVVYSYDDGKTVYSDLRVNPIWNDEFLVNAYIIDGDTSNTLVYAFGKYDDENPPTEFYTDLTKQYKIRLHSFTYVIDDNTYTSYAFSKYSDFGNVTIDETEIYNESTLYYTDLTFSVLYNGNTSGASITGINYTKQSLNLTKDEIKTNDLIKTYIAYENAKTTIYNSSVNAHILNNNIYKGSMYISYIFNNKSYIANVDIDGVIVGKGITYGRYNYETNSLTVAFSEKIKHNITMKYTYKFDVNLCTTKEVTINYNLKNKIEITELGLEDKEHNLLAYCTFPPIQTNSIRDYISSLFIINKMNKTEN